MEALALAMIYAGSALMVYNIVRCCGFVKRTWRMSGLEKVRSVLPVPLVLLVLFLIGYLTVALFGSPDLVIAGILLGGSVFVLVVFGVMYQVIDRLSEATARSDARYEEIRGELEDLAKDYELVLRVNLTRDVVEEQAGRRAHEGGQGLMRYTDFVELRKSQLMIGADDGVDTGTFSREGLLKRFAEGATEVEETAFVTLADGQPSFVKLQATLVVQPGTSDVVAFMTESACNDDAVNEVLLNRALIGQFDMITSLVDGRYSVVIGDAGNVSRGSIFPAEKDGDYNGYLERQVFPVICGAVEDRRAALEALSIERVERELARREPYEVNIAVDVDGGVYYKRFSYYVVDRKARFYLLLKSDTTEARREEIERSTQLAHALEEAQLASRSKTAFLSNISHDIRTPMNAIVGYTEFARNSHDMEAVQGYLERIDASSKYMLALLNDVLEMSRIESGKMELDPVPASLIVLMDEARDLFEAQMAEKGVAFTVDSSQVRIGCVYCDTTRFNRLVLNLLSNAYKFTPEGGRVDVSLVQLDDAREGFGAYELRVKDTGIGMSAEFAERVFEAFERERTTTVSGVQGTGLGMSISKSIVDLMGGTIDVVTEQGAGTEFIVRFELELQEDAREGFVPCGASRRTGTEVDFTGMRVLLVEDHLVNREIATMVLESLGFAVDEAVDGKQALDALVAAGPGRYDAVITDIQMPVMDGYEETRAIRALDDPALAGIPIVAMSANAFQEDVKASREAGMDAHVAKPIDRGALVETLNDVLSRRR